MHDRLKNEVVKCVEAFENVLCDIESKNETVAMKHDDASRNDCLAFLKLKTCDYVLKNVLQKIKTLDDKKRRHATI